MTLAAALGWPACTARAQEADEPSRVVSVDVQGTKTISRDTALAQLQTRPGSPYSDTVSSEDIRRLYALGYFTDVQVDTKPLEGGTAVTFIVREKPAIRSVDISGFRRLRKPRIEELLGIKAGELFDTRRLKDGLDQVKAEYRGKGYYQAEAAYSTVEHAATNDVDVRIAIDEGPRMRIKQILIEGNLAFADRKIRKLLKTKRRHWFFGSGVYDEQKLEEDLERIRSFYRTQGYQDVAVAKELLIDPKGDGLFVHLKIAEGAQHRVGDVDVAGTVLFPEHEIKRVLRLKPGAVYSTESLQEDLRAIKQYYGDRGYINAQVVPETDLDEASKRVQLTYRIVENELAYVNRVDIRGNLQTKDVVVRREMRLKPGEAFNGKAIRRSVERLYNLGYFEEVNVDTQPTGKPNREDLIVDVKEAKTGSFSIGGGFSSVDRVVGLLELEQRNFDIANWPTFMGAGQDLRFRTEIGSTRRFFELSFTEPWIFGHPLSFGVDLFNRTRLRSRNLGLAYEEERRGGGLRFGKEVTDTFRVDWGYQFFRTEISDVVEEASADLRAESGINDVSVVGTTLTWDSRDNRFDPTRGAVLFAGGDLAGGLFAGDKDFYRLQGGASYYLPHMDDRLVFESRVRTGIVNSYGDSDEVPIFERFFAGGTNTIRGFRERRVGPRDLTSNDPIGGEALLVATVEEVLSVLEDSRGKSILKTSAFLDIGNVWRRIDDYAGSMEAGTGIGLRVNTPIGPVRVDLGFPITEIETDEGRKPRLHFNVSRSF